MNNFLYIFFTINNDRKKYNDPAIFAKVKITAIEPFIKDNLPRFFLHR